MTEPYVPHTPATTEGFYKGTSVHPESGRVSTPLQDAMNYGSKAGGFLKDAFSSVSGFMDDHPVFTKWAVGGIAFLGLLQFGMNKGMLNMLGDNIIGRTICFALVAALALGGGSMLADWASNKGADKRVGNTGRLENTATVPAPSATTQQGGTTGNFNNNAAGVAAVQPAPQLSPNRGAAPESPRAEPLSGLNNVFAPP